MYTIVSLPATEFIQSTVFVCILYGLLLDARRRLSLGLSRPNESLLSRNMHSGKAGESEY